MKKIISILLAVVMMFTMLLAPSTAQDAAEDAQTNYSESNFFEDLFEGIHGIFGDILAFFGLTCPICREVHGEDDGETTYKLDVVSSFGGETIDVTGRYKEGSVIEILALPDDGWEFSRWESNNGGWFENDVDSSTKFTMPNVETTIVAVFSKAGQEPLTEEEEAVYRAYYGTEIGFSAGDFADSVTQKLTLPKTFGENEQMVDIEWVSSLENCIDKEGNVSRDESENKIVVLTAIFSKGETSFEKEFTVKVIKVSDILKDEIEDSLVTDLEELNKDAEYELEVEYNEDGTRVEYISGTYSEVVVESVDNALLSLYSVKSMIGLNDPSSQLKWIATNYDDVTLNYSFNQEYMGIEVYGSTITVNAEKETGKTLSLSANVVPYEVLNTVDCNANLSEDEITDLFLADGPIKSCSKVIYSLNEYNETPLLCYIIETSDEMIIVDADEGVVINRYDTVTSLGDYSTTGKGKNEQGSTITFPVQFHQWDWWFYYQEDVVRNIELFGGNHSMITKEFNTEWGDQTANSAYTNIIKAYDYFYNKFKRKSVDNNGKKIEVNVHNERCSGTNNAHSHGSDGVFCFFDNSSGNLPTTAAGYDIAVHEYTHNVFGNIINTYFPYSGETGSINEGYADIFACFADIEDWLVGEDWIELRNIANPESLGCPSKISSSAYYIGTDQSTLVHTNATVVSHAAYLMHTYGIIGSRLEKLWYNSMSQGYNANSTFKTLRRNVIQAAKNNGFSDSELAKVRKAFDAVEIYDEKSDLTIKIVDSENNMINLTSLNARISLQRTKYDVPGVSKSVSTVINPVEIKDLYFGDYNLNIDVDGYVPFVSKINLAKNCCQNITIKLVKEGVAKVSGTITSATTARPISGAMYELLAGLNMTTGTVVKQGSTDSNGDYLFEIPAGYYTMIVSSDGYVTGYFNIIVDGGKEITNNLSISPVLSGKDFRVVLRWGANPKDLDSHLFGYLETGSDYHIYYRNKNAYSDGNNIANLDVDDTTSYGPETTTFVVDATGKYEYYIDWFAGSGTWASSGGHIEVYNGDRLVYDFVAPNVNSKSGSWKVFTIENGIFTAHNMIQSNDIYE
ncbi:MAG: M4 family metallopeptidase [Clostridia bacterium]|nr:M4 family metallopeptidase [Clostridia bacterium]